MAKFVRQGSAALRALEKMKRKERVAKKLAALPAVTLSTLATEERSEADNIIIFRTHAKRLGVKRLKLTAAETKRMMADSRDVTARMLAGNTRMVKDLLTKVGGAMRKAIQGKIDKERLIKTGQLRRSIAYRLENV